MYLFAECDGLQYALDTPAIALRRKPATELRARVASPVFSRPRPSCMQGPSAQQLLETIRSRSAALDTTMKIDGDKGVIKVSENK